MYTAAISARPVRPRVNASHVKVEKVVNPPISPTATGVMTETGR